MATRLIAHGTVPRGSAAQASAAPSRRARKFSLRGRSRFAVLLSSIAADGAFRPEPSLASMRSGHDTLQRAYWAGGKPVLRQRLTAGEQVSRTAREGVQVARKSSGRGLFMAGPSQMRFRTPIVSTGKRHSCDLRVRRALPRLAGLRWRSGSRVRGGRLSVESRLRAANRRATGISSRRSGRLGLAIVGVKRGRARAEAGRGARGITRRRRAGFVLHAFCPVKMPSLSPAHTFRQASVGKWRHLPQAQRHSLPKPRAWYRRQKYSLPAISSAARRFLPITASRLWDRSDSHHPSFRALGLPARGDIYDVVMGQPGRLPSLINRSSTQPGQVGAKGAESSATEDDALLQADRAAGSARDEAGQGAGADRQSPVQAEANKASAPAKGTARLAADDRATPAEDPSDRIESTARRLRGTTLATHTDEAQAPSADRVARSVPEPAKASASSAGTRSDAAKSAAEPAAEPQQGDKPASLPQKRSSSEEHRTLTDRRPVGEKASNPKSANQKPEGRGKSLHPDNQLPDSGLRKASSGGGANGRPAKASAAGDHRPDRGLRPKHGLSDMKESVVQSRATDAHSTQVAAYQAGRGFGSALTQCYVQSVPSYASASVAVSRLVPELSAAMRRLLKEGRQELRLRLHPPRMGRMRIRVVTQRDTVRAAFFVEHPEVKALLEQSLPGLLRSLHQQGIKLESLSVTVQGGSSEGLSNGQSEGRGEHLRTPVPVAEPDNLDDQNLPPVPLLFAAARILDVVA